MKLIVQPALLPMALRLKTHILNMVYEAQSCQPPLSFCLPSFSAYHFTYTTPAPFDCIQPFSVLPMFSTPSLQRALEHCSSFCLEGSSFARLTLDQLSMLSLLERPCFMLLAAVTFPLTALITMAIK